MKSNVHWFSRNEFQNQLSAYSILFGLDFRLCTINNRQCRIYRPRCVIAFFVKKTDEKRLDRPIPFESDVLLDVNTCNNTSSRLSVTQTSLNNQIKITTSLYILEPNTCIFKRVFLPKINMYNSYQHNTMYILQWLMPPLYTPTKHLTQTFDTHCTSPQLTQTQPPYIHSPLTPLPTMYKLDESNPLDSYKFQIYF